MSSEPAGRSTSPAAQPSAVQPSTALVSTALVSKGQPSKGRSRTPQPSKAKPSAGRSPADDTSSAGQDTQHRSVLVTGADTPLGRALLDLLATVPGVRRLVGVVTGPAGGDEARLTDPVAARETGAGYQIWHADPDGHDLPRLLAEIEPTTVVHLAVFAGPAQAGGRAAMKERNIIGTMQLLAACQRSPGLRRLVVRSSAAVYGCAPRDPALFTETTTPHQPPRAGYGKDLAEIEGYVRGFGRRRPEVAVTVLRFAPVLGPYADTPLAAYLTLPILPVLLGFDPRLQFVHGDDALAALRLATLGAHPGTYNVAGAGSLLLSQVARRIGRPTVPVPSFASPLVGQLLRRGGLVDFTGDQLDLFSYGRVLDTTAMRLRLGLRARYDTAGVLDAHIAAYRLRGLPGMTRLVGAIDRVRDRLAERDSAHFRQPFADGSDDDADTADGIGPQPRTHSEHQGSTTHTRHAGGSQP